MAAYARTPALRMRWPPSSSALPNSGRRFRLSQSASSRWSIGREPLAPPATVRAEPRHRWVLPVVTILAVDPRCRKSPTRGRRGQRAKRAISWSSTVIPSVARDLGGRWLEDRASRPRPTQVPRYARMTTILRAIVLSSCETRSTTRLKPTATQSGDLTFRSFRKLRAKSAFAYPGSSASASQ